MSNRKTNQSGNVFFAIFGAVALVGILGAAVMTFIKGPLATSVKLTKMNTAENQMAIGSQVAVMASAAQANNGDCDGDGAVEPVGWRAATTEPVPTNGGLVPLTIGISKKDPWGTEYGYCVWNHGSTTSAGGCVGNWLTGLDTSGYSAQTAVALVSAGPDKAFTTTCRTFATADVNSDDDLLDATDLQLVSKAAVTDDDIIVSYTYQEATGASGGLWQIKSGEPQTATIGTKNIETTGRANLRGGLLLPDKALINCNDINNAGVMAKNGTAIEICDGAGTWTAIGGGGGGGAIDDLSDAISDTTSTVFLGTGSGTASTGTGNTGLGINALATNVAGRMTTAVGFEAMRYANSTAVATDTFNTALGYQALRGSTTASSNTGTQNTAVGHMALLNTTSGGYNSALGIFALYDNQIGHSNVALGSGALYSNVGGNQTTAVGYQAMYNANSAAGAVTTFNTAVGVSALRGSATPANNTGTANTAIGHYSLSGNTSGSYNTALGGYALSSNAAGSNSTAIGYQAMYNANNSTTAFSAANTAVGYQSLTGSGTPANNTGVRNTAIGYQSLNANTSGSYNVASGHQTLALNAIGSLNTAYGYQALTSNVGGNRSVAIGYQSMYYADSVATSKDTYNTAVGYQSLMGSTTASANTGVHNVALGYQSLYVNTSGNYNVGIGVQALAANSSGLSNTAIGHSAMLNSTTGNENLAIGYTSLRNNTLGGRNVAVGHGTLYTNVRATGSTAVGFEAMGNANSTAGALVTYNTAVGYQALMGSGAAASNTGQSNTAIGYRTMASNTYGSWNTAVGNSALSSNIASGNTAIGHLSLATNTVGTENLAAGYESMYSNVRGYGNVALGPFAFRQNTAGSLTVAIGYNAMYYADSANSGFAFETYNTAVGVESLRGSTTAASNTGKYNTALGYYSLRQNTTGLNNLAIGYNAGNAGTANTTGSNNTWVGNDAQSNANNYNNSTALGNGATITATNQVVLGNSSIAEIRAQVTSITAISDRRKKHDIHPMPLGLDFIDTLKPVSYRYNSGDETLRYGFIAQDLESALPAEMNKQKLAIVHRDSDPDKTYVANYGELISPMVKAIQDLHGEVKLLKASGPASQVANDQGLPKSVLLLLLAVAALAGWNLYLTRIIRTLKGSGK